MSTTGDQTLQLLQRWHTGDRAALQSLLDRNLPFVRKYAHNRLGQLLKAKADTVDYVQDAVLQFLRYGPRFLLADEGQFRALLLKMLENVLRDKADWYTAKRRQMDKERPLPSDSVIGLDPRARSVTRPSVAAERSESEALIRLALELLQPEDRMVIVLREFDGLQFAAIGERMELSENTVRMKFQRALPKLAVQVKALSQGTVH